MEQKLKQICKKCTEGSIKTYIRSLKRLYKLVSTKDIPMNGIWLGKEDVQKKYEKLPLSKRRSLSASALIASKAFKNQNAIDYWLKAVTKDSSAYDSQRSKNLSTDKESELWTGMNALKKASTEYKRIIAHIFRTPTYTTRDLFLYTKYLILRFYSSYAFRNDLATIQIEGNDQDNTLVKGKGIFTVRMRKFKASNKIGDLDIPLDKNLSGVVKKYLAYRDKVEAVDHKFLLSNSKGKPLSKRMVGNILRELTQKLLGKKFATRQIRVMQATEDRKVVDLAQQLANKQLHSIKQHKQYSRKDK